MALVEIERFTTFATAAKYAKQLANRHNEPVQVRRSGNAWSVFANSAVVNSMLAWERESSESVTQFEDYDGDGEIEDAARSDQEWEEAWMDQRRSDQMRDEASVEDGWYYPD